MITFVTTRYNNETWQANYENRIRRKKSCIYCSPVELSPKIHYNTPVFVIEMNNSINKIEGIGLIKNNYETTYYKIQKDGNYNRYVYIGNFHLNRDIIENYNPMLVLILEKILFKGYTHSKRGTGMTCIPEKVLNMDICEGINVKKEIKELFIYHFREKINELTEKKAP
jgi:hypothetical protein